MRKKEKKNIIRAILIVIVSCFVLLLPFSCQDKQEILPKNDPLAEINEFFVDENAAVFFADNFAKTFKATSDNSLKSKKLKSLTKFKDEEGEDLIYVINYEDGGFLLLSADQRVEPILAFSETNSFITEESDLPDGISFWVIGTKEEIKRAKKENKEQSKEIKFLWDKYLSYSQLKVYIPPDPCEDEVITVGPFLQTTWDQGCDYNSLLQTEAQLGCTGFQCGKAKVGCVSVAMAQIMKYHQYPSSYSWSSMPNNEGTNATAQLMKDINESTIDMQYYCNGSRIAGSTTTIETAFENDFGYSTSVTHANYNYSTVVSEINNNRPVILIGTDGDEAHAWVCDGYQSRFYCNTGGTYLYFNMNWGLLYADCNGYFAYNNFNPGDYELNTDRKMITGIKP